MPDRDTTKRMFTHMINMMEQHDTMTISCGDPLMKLLKDVRKLLNEQPEIVRCADCRHADISPSGLIKCRGIFRSREWYCADGERREDE